MTLTVHRTPSVPAAIQAPPGWNIAVDLTPPELRTRRALGQLRRIIAVVLVLAVLACIGLFVAAGRSVSKAQKSYDSVSTQTTAIQSRIAQHSLVTRVRAASKSVDGQLAKAFAGDIDSAELLVDLQRVLPQGMTLTSANVAIAAPAASGSTAGSASSGIAGTVTLSGTSTDLVDLSEYVYRLHGIGGVIGIVPTSNTAGDGNAGSTGAWSLTLQLNERRLTHRFAGGK